MARILIADDHMETRFVLRALIETRRGWQVCGEASSGREAVLSAFSLKPDLVILDLVMPWVDGILAAGEITKAMPGMPILLFTLYNTPGLEHEAKKAGIRTVVDKKDASKLLLGSIERMLDGGASTATA